MDVVPCLVSHWVPPRVGVILLWCRDCSTVGDRFDFGEASLQEIGEEQSALDRVEMLSDMMFEERLE